MPILSSELSRMLSEYDAIASELEQCLLDEIQQLKQFQLTPFQQQSDVREMHFAHNFQKLREILDWCSINTQEKHKKTALKTLFGSLHHLYELMDQYHQVLEKAIAVQKAMQFATQKVKAMQFATYGPQGELPLSLGETLKLRQHV